ncbi:MAG: hypothetical protein JXD22_10290 [Sedimentisphaerales bacterium]|nr:hypothetical protein [Sedimentisphaerales bacterium]
MNQEMLEILIGKFIDSEITPAEQRLLDEELTNNPQARLLLRQFQQIHEQARQLVSQEILPAGDSPETIFSRALATQERAGSSPNIFHRRWANLAASVAAALLVGLLSYAAYREWAHQAELPPAKNDTDIMANNSATSVDIMSNNSATSDSSTAVAVADNEGNPKAESPRLLRQTNTYKFSHLPDVMVYSDPSGSQWLLEVVPENANQVQNVAYQGDI